MKLVCKKPMRYATRSLKAGDDFEATAQDARILLAIGRASMPGGFADELEPEEPEDSEEPEEGKAAQKPRRTRRSRNKT